MAKIFDSKRHTDQRMRLLSHARRLFAAKGVKETSMSQIAKACKVTKATLYHYFKSKEAVLKEILAYRSEEIENVSQSPLPKNLDECFYQLGKAHLNQMEKSENLELMKILLSETMKNNEMKKFYISFVFENISRGAKEVLLPLAGGKKNEAELRLLFFQFMASLIHYNWNTKMVGHLTNLLGSDETFLKRLAKTYALAVQNP